MTAWTPPSFSYYRQSDGTILILDETGNPVLTPPNMQFLLDKDGGSLVLDPWGNEIPAYTFSAEFRIHTAIDGTLTAVDASGTPLPVQPEMHHGLDPGDPPFAVLPGIVYKQALPDNVHVHTARDGTRTAYDSDTGILPVQPDLDYWYDSRFPPDDVDALASSGPVIYEAPAYEFPGQFFIHTAADGSMTAVDVDGVLLPTQPEMHHGLSPGDPDFAVLPPGWAEDEPPEYKFPEGTQIWGDGEGNLTVVDEFGNPLPTQPDSAFWSYFRDYPYRRELSEETSPVVPPNPVKYEPPEYEFPEEFFIHTAADGSMTAVDAGGVPLPTQPEMHHGLEGTEPDFVDLPDGSAYVPKVYEFPDTFFIHTAADGSMTAVDAGGVPLPTQPEMHHGLEGTELDFVDLPDGSAYVPKVYEFPDTFFIHTAADGSMTAVDAGGVPLPTQPEMHHGLEGTEPDFAVLPDGTKYEADSLYPPPGELPDEWPADEPESVGGETADETGGEGDDTSEPESVADSNEQATEDEEPAGESPFSDLDPARNYSRVEFQEGEMLLDEDWSGDEPATEVATVQASRDLLTAGLVDAAPGDTASVIPINVPDGAMPVGDGVVSATPITLPGEELPVMSGMGGVSGPGDEVSVIPINIPDGAMPVGDEVVSATPITLPGEELPVMSGMGGVSGPGDEVSVIPINVPDGAMPVGDEVVSATPITLPGEEVSVIPINIPDGSMPVAVPVPPAASDVDDGEIALDRKGDDRPVEYKFSSPPEEPAAEFQVEVIDEVQVEEVRLEDVEARSIELAEPIAEYGDAPAEEEDVDDLDG